MSDTYFLDEEAAQNWLTGLIVAVEMSDLGDGGDASFSAGVSATGTGAEMDPFAPQDVATPLIGLGWDPRAPGQEDTTSLLVQQAQRTGALIGPSHSWIAIQYVDDGDDWAFQWLLCFAEPAQLTVASKPYAIARLGGGHNYGIDAACAILHEAVEAANTLRGQVAAFCARFSTGPG